jgi:hypothetical protein
MLSATGEAEMGEYISFYIKKRQIYPCLSFSAFSGAEFCRSCFLLAGAVREIKNLFIKGGKDG